MLHTYPTTLARQILLAVSATTLIACTQPSDTASTQPESGMTINADIHSDTDANIKPSSEALAIDQISDQMKSEDDKSPKSLILQQVSATVYKDPNCGCCSKWIEYAESAGMQATVQHPDDLSLFKDRYGVPQQMRSCHTTVTEDGYVFEGHIPTKYIAQFLKNPPADAIGLAVPSMPVGSPGMEYKDKFLPYQVFQLNKDGTTTVFAEVESKAQQI